MSNTFKAKTTPKLIYVPITNLQFYQLRRILISICFDLLLL